MVSIFSLDLSVTSFTSITIAYLGIFTLGGHLNEALICHALIYASMRSWGFDYSCTIRYYAYSKGLKSESFLMYFED